MTSGLIASVVAILALFFVEIFGQTYPSKQTWRKLRRVNGRTAVRAMRERFEAAAAGRSARILALVLVVLVAVWVASASLLDKRWYEVVLDVFPYGIVALALLRVPSAMHHVAERMRCYEIEEGEDPDGPGPGENGEVSVLEL